VINLPQQESIVHEFCHVRPEGACYSWEASQIDEEAAPRCPLLSHMPVRRRSRKRA
jgi:hypothetical protein